MIDYDYILGATKAKRFDWLCDNYDALGKHELHEFNAICSILREAEDEDYMRQQYNAGMAEAYGPDYGNEYPVFDGAW